MHSASFQACHGNAFGFEVANKDKERKLAIYRAGPWISNCWERDPNSGSSGLESSALTIRLHCLGDNFASQRDFTLIVPQPISASRCWLQEKKIGTCRGTCAYCTISIGIIWCMRASLMYAEMNMYSGQEQNHFEYYMTANASQTCKCVTWHDTQNPVWRRNR